MKNQHSEEQIICSFGESKRTALTISDARQRHGISEQTCYRWTQKYGGMEISEARPWKQLDKEHSLGVTRLATGL